MFGVCVWRGKEWRGAGKRMEEEDGCHWVVTPTTNTPYTDSTAPRLGKDDTVSERLIDRVPFAWPTPEMLCLQADLAGGTSGPCTRGIPYIKPNRTRQNPSANLINVLSSSALLCWLSAERHQNLIILRGEKQYISSLWYRLCCFLVRERNTRVPLMTSFFKPLIEHNNPQWDNYKEFPHNLSIIVFSSPYQCGTLAFRVLSFSIYEPGI